MATSGTAETRGVSVRWRVDRGHALVAVTGEVDIASCHVLGKALAEVLDGAVEAVVVDLDGVTFLDSSGIRVLLTGRRMAADRGAGLRVSNARDSVEQVLLICGVLDILTGSPVAKDAPSDVL